jgi:hypothetical protein
MALTPLMQQEDTRTYWWQIKEWIIMKILYEKTRLNHKLTYYSKSYIHIKAQRDYDEKLTKTQPM